MAKNEIAEQIIHDDWLVRIDDIVHELNISHGSPFSVIHKWLHYCKVCARWVSCSLTDQYRYVWNFKITFKAFWRVRRRVSQLHINRWWDIVSSHRTTKSKQQNMVWKQPSSSTAKDFKSQPFTGKLVMTVFWDMKGVLLIHYTLKAQTMNSNNYCELL